jgi:hypothetical protein
VGRQGRPFSGPTCPSFRPTPAWSAMRSPQAGAGIRLHWISYWSVTLLPLERIFHEQAGDLTARAPPPAAPQGRKEGAHLLVPSRRSSTSPIRTAQRYLLYSGPCRA